MHVGEDLNGIRSQAGIHIGEVAQRGGHNHGKQVVVAGGKTPILFNLFLDADPGGDELGGIRFGDQGHTGGGMHAGGQTLGDDDGTHALKRDALKNFGLLIVDRGRRSEYLGLGSAGNITLDDAPARAGACDGMRVEADIGGHALGDRGDLGRLGQEGQHVAFCDAQPAVAGGRHAGKIDVFGSGKLAGARRGKELFTFCICVFTARN